jgi:hypothetical protein
LSGVDAHFHPLPAHSRAWPSNLGSLVAAGRRLAAPSPSERAHLLIVTVAVWKSTRHREHECNQIDALVINPCPTSKEEQAVSANMVTIRDNRVRFRDQCEAVREGQLVGLRGL